jgi:hypothetical protein
MIMFENNRFLRKLKEQAEDNPILAIGVATALIHAVAKFIDASGSISSKRTYARTHGSSKRR